MEDLYICQTCYAMVHNDYYYEHQSLCTTTITPKEKRESLHRA